jgi:hypothetical protein
MWPAVEHLGNKPDCVDDSGTAAAAAAAGPDMVAEVSQSPHTSMPAAAATGGFANPGMLAPLSTVKEESCSFSTGVTSRAASGDVAAAPAAAAAAAIKVPASLQSPEPSGDLSPIAQHIHSDVTPFAHPHHNISCQAAAAAAGSSSNAPVAVVPHRQFQSFSVAEEEPSDAATKISQYDSSQVVLVHRQCLLRSSEAQQLVSVVSYPFVGLSCNIIVGP